MKTQEQIKNRINKMNKRIKSLWVQYDESKSDFLVNKIDVLEEKIEMLNWVLSS
tara:strand:+ start:549 stop:710 length:162 start_codon:yes stop_codon:yes gene_type:complete